MFRKIVQKILGTIGRTSVRTIVLTIVHSLVHLMFRRLAESPTLLFPCPPAPANQIVAPAYGDPKSR